MSREIWPMPLEMYCMRFFWSSSGLIVWASISKLTCKVISELDRSCEAIDMNFDFIADSDADIVRGHVRGEAGEHLTVAADEEEADGDFVHGKGEDEERRSDDGELEIGDGNAPEGLTVSRA